MPTGPTLFEVANQELSQGNPHTFYVGLFRILVREIFSRRVLGVDRSSNGMTWRAVLAKIMPL
jgi:hypothetical protein